jgi:hypothetical protein
VIICVRFGRRVIRDDRSGCIAPDKSRKYQCGYNASGTAVFMPFARPKYPRHANRSKTASVGAMSVELSDPLARL